MLLAGAGVVWGTGCSLVLAPVLGSDSADLPGFGKQGRGPGVGGVTPERHQWVLHGGAPCALQAGPTGRAGG